MARGDYEGLEPDRMLSLICPHCATWFRKDKVQSNCRELVLCETSSSGVREVFYCDSENHEKVELLDAAESGNLTAWEEWKRDQLLDEMDQLERKIKIIQRELNDYFMWENGRGC